MPFPAASDLPGFLRGLLGILVVAAAITVADLAARLLLRWPPVRDLPAGTRKTVAVLVLFAATAGVVAAGIAETTDWLLACLALGGVSFLLAVRSSGS